MSNSNSLTQTNMGKAVRQPIPGQAPARRDTCELEQGVWMTMGLGALEEIVTGNRTRQRLPYAEVNSPNHPPGTWSPDSRGEVEPLAWPRLQAAGTEEPQPRLINHDCDVSLLLVPPCWWPACAPPFHYVCPKPALLNSPPFPYLFYDHTQLSPPKTAVLQFNHLWMWVEVAGGGFGGVEAKTTHYIMYLLIQGC